VKGISAAEREELFPEGLVLAGYRGSIAHGTYRPAEHEFSTDDKDLMGVYIGPLEQYFGLKALWKPKPWQRQIREWDVVCYELRRYVQLLLKSNPNVLSLLWLTPKHYILQEHAGALLVENRQLFVSKQMYHSFVGYAHGQLVRMTRHKKSGYMGAKRKRLVEQFGHDVKNAECCVRTLRMGIEFLVEGELHVERADAQQLLEIKNGEWSLEQVKAEADRLFAVANEAHIHSKLPVHPDREGAERLLVSILRDHFEERSGFISRVRNAPSSGNATI